MSDLLLLLEKAILDEAIAQNTEHSPLLVNAMLLGIEIGSGTINYNTILATALLISLMLESDLSRIEESKND